MIRQLEEHSMRAWPALQHVEVDGWVARFADGYTRRANSVHPLDRGRLPVEEKIRTCEALYRAAGQPILFKLTSVSAPAELDALLQQRGYASEGGSNVQLRVIRAGDAQEGVVQWDHPHSAWISALMGLAKLPEHRRETLTAMVRSIEVPARFALIAEEGEPVSCGLGVVHGGYLGLFDIVTREDRRGRGLATRVIRHLLHSAAGLDGRFAYLQVLQSNEPAMRLYAKLGFRDAYSYWYRVMDGNCPASH